MKSLTIGIEATQVGARGAERHGIYRYLQQLLLGFKTIGSPHRFRLWINSFRRSQLNGIPDFLAEIGWKQVEVAVCRFPARLLRRFDLPIDRSIGQIDLFHGPSHLLPRLRRGKTIVTIHDLAFLRMSESLKMLNPDWCASIQKRSPHPNADIAAYRSRCNFFLMLQKEVPYTLERADRIIAVSRATARDLVKLAGVSEKKIRVVSNGLTPGFEIVRDKEMILHNLAGLGIKEKYILYVGVQDPNKDLHTLIKGFAQTSESFRKEYRLVISGPCNWFKAVLEDEADRLGVKDLVLFTGYVPDSLLPVLYSGATALVAPSPLEGFGLPVLEAMACGAPVIIVDSGALPEVAGEAALMVPPNNPHTLSKAMEQLAGDTTMVSELVNRGFTQIQDFSWDKTAQKTLEVYEEIAG